MLAETERFRESILQVINSSNMRADIALYVLRDVVNEVEKAYSARLSAELAEKKEKNVVQQD